MPQYPREVNNDDWDAWWESYQEKTADMTDPAAMTHWFTTSIPALMQDAGKENRVCSPLNIYMALSMLAAVTDGQTRQQILDALGAESLELLQKQTAQLWTENSSDDGLVTSTLANSIWLRNGYSYNEETLQKLGEEFYASAFSGEMGTDAYNNMLRDWINEHTGNLLTEQASGLELAPATVLALVSTIYYRASWSDKFSSTATTQDVFHAPNGDVTVDCSTLDDQILIKGDGMPTYNFANVVDDHTMGITHVIRGNEYLSSTPKYNLLYEAFGWEIPTYIHCPPVMKDAQNKLSKRNGDASYQDLVAKGYLTEAVLNYICLLGWSPRGEYAEQEIFSLPELVKIWSPEGISKSPAIFDPLKLRAINAEYIRRLSPEEFLAKAEPWIDSAVHTPINKKLLCANLQPRCEVLGEIPEQLDFFDAMPEYDVSLYANKKQKTTPESAKEALEALLPVLSDEALDFNDRDTVFDACKAKAEELGKKNGWLLYPLGIALSGKQRTPGGGTDLACMMGREKTLQRVQDAIAKLNG